MTVLTVDEPLPLAGADLPAPPAGGAVPAVDVLAEAAGGALRRVLDVRGCTGVGAVAVVYRTGRHLRVRLITDAAVPAAVLTMAAVRALGAVRALDPDTPTIGVGGAAR